MVARVRVLSEEEAARRCWRVERLEVRCGGDALSHAELLLMKQSALLWLAPNGCEALGRVILAMPGEDGGPALATVLDGPDDASDPTGTARRLATVLRRPVMLALAAPLDRLTAPHVERALLEKVRHIVATHDKLQDACSSTMLNGDK